MVTWTLAASLLLGAPALKDVRKPTKPPAGKWAVERLEFDGSVIIKAQDRHCVHQFIPTGRWQTLNGLHSFDAAAFFEAAGGLEADFNPDDPKKLRKAIWKVEGDTLSVCEARPGAARPTEYIAPQESRRSLWVLKRVED
jgi:hypothetical protein